ncbi:MAG: transglutaminase family protein [Gammaproteobacteria bacterium]|nr:transglutaminase family protein [Gammaproteobacteria bacterium]NNC97008.1 transglutaminase family protein [Gammaproteobacteria bacterium]NNM14367.1 transglutaminase family protein [Gammaproteobacteria bacterium]
MLIKIDHSTSYQYDTEANYSIQSLRLTPQPVDGQRILSWNIHVEGNNILDGFTDSFGNLTHTLVISKPHKSICIRVQGEIETSDTNGVVSGGLELFPEIFYLRETSQTIANQAIIEQAEKAEQGTENILDCLHYLMGSIRSTIDYQTGQTHANTTAAEAIQNASGVCQDHAHVFLSAARYLDIPARYISGYLLHSDTGEESEASHAWAEAFVPDLGWVGFDVSNNVCVNEMYVRVAIGLDYHDAAPVRGVRRGGEGEKLTVSVHVNQVGEAAQ